MKIITSLSILLFASFSIHAQNSDKELLEKAKKIHEKVITIDTHDDFDVENFTSEKNYTMDLDTQVNLPKMEKGGMDVTWLVVYTGQGELNAEGYKAAYENAMAKFDAIHRLVEEYAPGKIALATTSDEVREILASGKKVAMIGVENGYSIGLDLKNVEKFYELGARYMSLAHNGHSQLSDSNTGEEDDVWLHHGLSELGKKVIVEMNRLGMMVDVSHPSKEAMRQMVEISKAPIIASHSSARALGHHSRNLDDEQLEWMKENGGVVQAVAYHGYINTEKSDAFTKEVIKIYEEVGDKMKFKVRDWEEVEKWSKGDQKAYEQKYKQIQKIAEPKIEKLKKTVPPIDVADFIDHVDYLVEKLGIDHVGISSDFDGGGGIEGWNDASESLNITLELVKRGYTEEEIAKLWGENLLRVLDEVQAVAADIQKEDKK